MPVLSDAGLVCCLLSVLSAAGLVCLSAVCLVCCLSCLSRGGGGGVGGELNALLRAGSFSDEVAEDEPYTDGLARNVAILMLSLCCGARAGLKPHTTERLKG
jgi:hypothetical protein